MPRKDISKIHSSNDKEEPMNGKSTVAQIDDMEIENQEQDNEAFIEYDIASYPSDFTLDNLFSQWKKGSIVIPEFQREFVWDIEQASLLIDSFMMGLPVPPVFLYLDEESKYLVIDGQQRLLSIFFFFEGYFGKEEHGKRKVFKLKGIDESIRYAGKTFKEFAEPDRRKIEGSVLRAINIRQINPAKQNTSVYHIFERLNTGGTSLRPQEIRNCVFAGDFVAILKKLNKDGNWRKIIGKPALDKYQKDLELILRLFALLENGVASYEKPMKEYLNKAMQRNRVGDSDFAKAFQEQFSVTCQRIVTVLGEKPFHVRGPINTAYLDSVFCMVYSNIDKLPKDLIRRFNELTHDKEFNDQFTSAGTQDTAVLRKRFQKVEQALIGESE
ncbi:MAG: DUF262 domain-containing protein [Planctomycetota bacterium]